MTDEQAEPSEWYGAAVLSHETDDMLLELQEMFDFGDGPEPGYCVPLINVQLAQQVLDMTGCIDAPIFEEDLG